MAVVAFLKSLAVVHSNFFWAMANRSVSQLRGRWHKRFWFIDLPHKLAEFASGFIYFDRS
jgi:hypothetical protein